MQLFVKASTDDLSALLEKRVDGIIIGVRGFSVRMKDTVLPADLTVLAEQVKAADKKLWLNLNAFLHENDLDAAEALLARIADLPVDGVLFADFAILRLAKAKGLVERLVYHAETSPTFAEDVRFFANEGCQAVVLGRELTISSMEAFAAESTIPLAFVGQGRLNMFHSRRRLLSNYFTHAGMTSARPRAGADFTLREETRNEHYPVYEDAHGTHIFRGLPTQSFTVWQRLAKILGHFIVDGLFYGQERLLEIVDDCILARDGADGKKIAAKYPDHDEGFLFCDTFAKEGEKRR